MCHIPLPIPLEYLRLASFDAPAENRKEKAHSSTGEVGASSSSRIFDSFRTRYRLMYPFTLYHAAARSARRYTLYAPSETDRENWRKALEGAIGLRMARQESNMVCRCRASVPTWRRRDEC